MHKDIIIKIDNVEIAEYHSFNLTRSKTTMSGVLEIILLNSTNKKVNSKILNLLLQRKVVAVYIKNILAFTGTLTNYNAQPVDPLYADNPFADAKKTKGLVVHQTITQIRLKVEGRTNILNHGCHLVKDSLFTNTSVRKMIETLAKSYDIPVKWNAEDFKIESHQLASGGLVYDEILQICSNYGYYCYENRAGEIYITDKVSKKRGIDLILGKNIIDFESHVDLAADKSQIFVRGHINNRHDWGVNSIVKDSYIIAHNPNAVHKAVSNIKLNGTVNIDTLKHRALYENTQRIYLGQVIIINLWGFGDSSSFFDLGMIHRVKIDDIGLDKDLECIDILYTATIKNIGTRLTLAPIPVKAKDSTKTDINLFDKLPKCDLDEPGLIDVSDVRVPLKVDGMNSLFTKECVLLDPNGKPALMYATVESLNADKLENNLFKKVKQPYEIPSDSLDITSGIILNKGK